MVEKVQISTMKSSRVIKVTRFSTVGFFLSRGYIPQPGPGSGSLVFSLSKSYTAKALFKLPDFALEQIRRAQELCCTNSELQLGALISPTFRGRHRRDLPLICETPGLSAEQP